MLFNGWRALVACGRGGARERDGHRISRSAAPIPAIAGGGSLSRKMAGGGEFGGPRAGLAGIAAGGGRLLSHSAAGAAGGDELVRAGFSGARATSRAWALTATLMERGD